MEDGRNYRSHNLMNTPEENAAKIAQLEQRISFLLDKTFEDESGQDMLGDQPIEPPVILGDGSGITGRAQNGAETDVDTDTAKPWVRYRKSTFAFSEETVGPTVPTDPDYIYFEKANWGGGEIVIQ